MFFAMLHKASQRRQDGIAHMIGARKERTDGLVEKLIGHTIFHIALLLKQAGDSEEAAYLCQLTFISNPAESLGRCIRQMLEEIHRRKFGYLDRGHGIHPYISNLGQECFNGLEQAGQNLAKILHSRMSSFHKAWAKA